MSLVISIALGIVLAIIILNFLPEILALSALAVVGGGIVALLIAFFTLVPSKKEANVSSVQESSNTTASQSTAPPALQPAPPPQSLDPLSASAQTLLLKGVSDTAAPPLKFMSETDANAWLVEMSLRLKTRIPDKGLRLDFLKAVHYEATRAGLDPQLILAFIEAASNFKKLAVSEKGSMGYMQVSPSWVERIGDKDISLFHMRTNLRFGCTILRYYLDAENGDLYQALARYSKESMNLDDDKTKGFSNKVVENWENNWPYWVEPATFSQMTEAPP